MDQNLLAQRFREMYPVIKLDLDEYDPDKTYDHMVFLCRNGRCTKIIYGSKINYLSKDRHLDIWHMDSIPDMVYEADPKSLLIDSSGSVDLSKFPNLERISIRQMDPKLIELDDSLTHLKSISLRGTDNEFPEWIRLCPNLEELWINDCKISKLPDWLSELPIKRMQLMSVPMTDLPAWLPNLPLDDFEVEGLPLGKIPLVYRDWQKRSIHLPNCGIKEIPEWLGEATWLRSINLSHNSIDEVPSFLLEKLRINNLNLSHNCIQELPTGVWASQSFSELNLSHNLLKELPDDFGKMRVMKLKLNHNPIEELPPLKYCMNEILDLSETNLQYPMFWKQDHTWLQYMEALIVPDWWDMEMITAARRLIGFPEYKIYRHMEYLEKFVDGSQEKFGQLTHPAFHSIFDLPLKDTQL